MTGSPGVSFAATATTQARSFVRRYGHDTGQEFRSQPRPTTQARRFVHSHGPRHRPGVSFAATAHDTGEAFRSQPRPTTQARRFVHSHGPRHRPGVSFTATAHDTGQAFRSQPRCFVHAIRERTARLNNIIICGVPNAGCY